MTRIAANAAASFISRIGSKSDDELLKWYEVLSAPNRVSRYDMEMLRAVVNEIERRMA